MIKRLILISRRAELSGEEFRRTYIESHAPIVARMPGLRRYVQNAVLPGNDGREPDISGVAEVWYDDEDAFAHALASPEGAAANVSLARFTDAAQTRVLAVDEVPVLDRGASEARTLAVARSFYGPFESGDVDALDDILAPNWRIDPQAPGTSGGPAGYKPLLSAFRTAFPDVRVTIDDAFASDDKALVRTTMRATHRAPFLGVAASNRAIELRTSDVHRVRDGRIVQSWHLEDFFGFLLQTGAYGA
jgi:uncharacterized protein (TIGR02118 family)/steroid delta-isomerase-like uncharacterized protein